MLTKDESLAIIETHTTKEILMAMLKSMDGYHSLPLIDKTRRELQKHWSDNLWWPSDKMVDVVPAVFNTAKLNERLWSEGGSSAPEGYYYKDSYTCKICGGIIEVFTGHDGTHNDPKHAMHDHLRLHCSEILQDIRRKSHSLEDFKNNLLAYLRR